VRTLEAEPGRAAATAESESHPPPAKVMRSLNLELPDDLKLPPAESEHGLSARVFDRRLAGEIRGLRAGRSPRASAERHNGPRSERSRMQGAQWVSFVRIGDQCFEVIEADPSDQLSRDQWYSVSCDR
jgi:hypothetical protein